MLVLFEVNELDNLARAGAAGLGRRHLEEAPGACAYCGGGEGQVVLALGVDALREEQVGRDVGAQLVDEENVDPDQELRHGSRDGAPVLRVGLADLDGVEEGEHVAKGEAPLVGEGGDGAAAAEAVGEEPRRVRAAGAEVLADVVGRDEVLVEGAGPEPGQAAEAGEQGDEARDRNGEHGLHRPRLQALWILPREGRGFRCFHAV